MKNIGYTLDYDGQAAIIVAVRTEEDGSYRYDLRVFGPGGQDTTVPAAELDDEPAEGSLANEGGPDTPPAV